MTFPVKFILHTGQLVAIKASSLLLQNTSQTNSSNYLLISQVFDFYEGYKSIVMIFLKIHFLKILK
jgi:hypothetical protein